MVRVLASTLPTKVYPQTQSNHFFLSLMHMYVVHALGAGMYTCMQEYAYKGLGLPPEVFQIAFHTH